MEREPVDAVLGLDIDRLPLGIGEHALDPRGDHGMTVGVAENDHAPSNYRVADEESVVDATDAYGGALPPVIAYLARGDVSHLGSIGILSRSTLQFYARQMASSR